MKFLAIFVVVSYGFRDTFGSSGAVLRFEILEIVSFLVSDWLTKFDILQLNVLLTTFSEIQNF